MQSASIGENKMSIEIEYYLSCDECPKVYHRKSSDKYDIEAMAIDDGWSKKGEFSGRSEDNHHVCPECLEETK